MTPPYGGRVGENPGNEVEEGNAFFLDYQHGRRDGLKTIKNPSDHANATAQYACVATESTLLQNKSLFFVHFFAFTARLQKNVKMPNFTFCGGREHKTMAFSFPS